MPIAKSFCNHGAPLNPLSCFKAGTESISPNARWAWLVVKHPIFLSTTPPALAFPGGAIHKCIFHLKGDRLCTKQSVLLES